ncbi:hypothetical protein HNP84_004276 [Thermocatellispora tengchongensis]|uniref:Uncharacterized protein n=1 Tax=Thermocatellispora tengchongensis TaxID=1073253 RepID=A0A840P019_9ACTN|nr:hypothetical protein [Thermocatellispora tengchongensis]
MSGQVIDEPIATVAGPDTAGRHPASLLTSLERS